MSWRQGFTEKEILNMRRYLARLWKRKLDTVMDIEAVHYLKKEREEKQKIATGASRLALHKTNSG